MTLPEILVLSAPGLAPPAGLARLEGRARVRHTDAAGLAAALPGARALLMWDHFSPALPEAWPAADALEWVHVAAAGVDHVMFDALVASPVTVTNSRGVFDTPIAEYVLALLLAHVKDLRTTWADTAARRWHYREPVALAGGTTVVVGTGAIGRAIARLLRAVGVRVRGVARRARADDADFDEVVGADDLAARPGDVVGDADHLVVAAPLTPDTRGMVGTAVLAALPRRAHLVNVGRGPIVDTDALVAALHSGRLAAASLDVLDVEPPPAEHPLWSAPGILVSPHCSGDVVGWRDLLAGLFLDNVERFLVGGPLANVVDKRVGFVPGVRDVTGAVDEVGDVGEAAELLRTMIRNACVNTGDVASGQEIRNADTLAAYLGGALDVTVHDAAPGRRSLVARLEGTDPAAPSLGLLCHTDVVPASDADWTHDPFGAELVDGMIWGRGAIDMLDVTTTMAVAMRAAATSGVRPRGDVVFVAAADEEGHADHGVRHLLAHHRDEVLADRIVTEGGGWPLTTGAAPRLSWAVADKGSSWLRLDVHGRAGHAAMPWGADNALTTAAEVVRRLTAHRVVPRVDDTWTHWVTAMDFDAATTAGLLDPDRVLDTAVATGDPALAAHAHACTHMTITPTGARGGVAINSIPELVEIDVDARTLPGHGPGEVEAEIRSALGELVDRVDLVWRHRLTTRTSPVTSPLRDTVAGIADALVPGTRLVPGMITASTDADYFRRAGSEVYGFSMHAPYTTPEGFRRMFHGPDERVDLTSLRLSTALWSALIRTS